MNIGFIGLGIMGAPMALHLVDAGHQLLVNTVGKVPESVAATTAKPCSSAEEVTRNADIIFTMVPDTPDVEAVLFGKGGVAAGLQGAGGTRKIVVDMSSISPMATKAFAKKINEAGADYRLHQKDLGLALQGARELGLSLPQTANAAQLMQACAANGMADLDHSALVKALELMAGHEVAQA